jgi:putative membrane protein
MLARAASGVAGSVATAVSNRILEGAIPAEEKRREKTIREGSGHEVMANRLGRALGGTPAAKALAGVLFATAFGAGWGLIYGAVRRRIPFVGRYGGWAFGVPFFLVCDGAIAPLLGLSPSIPRVPWRFNAKELANHLVWTAATELATRAAAR